MLLKAMKWRTHSLDTGQATELPSSVEKAKKVAAMEKYEQKVEKATLWHTPCIMVYSQVPRASYNMFPGSGRLLMLGHETSPPTSKRRYP